MKADVNRWSCQVPLHAIAHGRAGDKGNCLNVSVIAYQESFWPWLTDQVTVERIHELFCNRGAVAVSRFELPNLSALNFVINNALDGGVNSSLALDTHGKTLSFMVLEMLVWLPRSVVRDAEILDFRQQTALSASSRNANTVKEAEREAERKQSNQS